MKNPPFSRIISLVPSLTKMLIDLGLKNQLVGRTRFCIHPEEEVEDIPIIGGTKNPRLDKISQLSPDYILANREENRKEDILKLSEKYHVKLTDISTIDEALAVIQETGQELGVPDKAYSLTQSIEAVLEERPKLPAIRTAYLIWKDPWMSVGRDTYIHNVMRHWQLENVFSDTTRYPEFTAEELAGRNPELILLSSEPYPFQKKHLPEAQKAFPDARILLVDGTWFSWYGSMMLSAFKQLNSWRTSID